MFVLCVGPAIPKWVDTNKLAMYEAAEPTHPELALPHRAEGKLRGTESGTAKHRESKRIRRGHGRRSSAGRKDVPEK
jgi:hypothetical protein